MTPEPDDEVPCILDLDHNAPESLGESLGHALGILAGYASRCWDTGTGDAVFQSDLASAAVAEAANWLLERFTRAQESTPHQPGVDDPVDQHPGLYTTRQRFDAVDERLDYLIGAVARLGAKVDGGDLVHAALGQRLHRIEDKLDRVSVAYQHPDGCDAQCPPFDHEHTEPNPGASPDDYRTLVAAPDTEGAAPPGFVPMPEGNGGADFDKVLLVSGKPSCRDHGAMNKVTPSPPGFWRCLHISGCRAGCAEGAAQ